MSNDYSKRTRGDKGNTQTSKDRRNDFTMDTPPAPPKRPRPKSK